MKKTCILLVMFTMVISISFGCSKEPEDNTKQSKSLISEELNYEGLVQYYAEKHEVSVGDAEKAINRMRILEERPDKSKAAAKYRVLSILLQVDCKYQPMLELYAEVAGDDANWTVSRVRGAAFVGAVNDQSWQFAGNVAFWLRENRQIEYDVNGDFGQNSEAPIYMDTAIEEDGSEGTISYTTDENTGELKNTAYCSQHDWVTYRE